MLINLHFVVRSSWKRVSEYTLSYWRWVAASWTRFVYDHLSSSFLPAHFYSSYEQLKKSEEFVDFNARACCTFYGLPPSPSLSAWNGLHRSRIVLYCSSNSWPLLLTEHRLTTAVLLCRCCCCCCVLAQPTTSLFSLSSRKFRFVSDLEGWIKDVICKNSTSRRQRLVECRSDERRARARTVIFSSSRAVEEACQWPASKTVYVVDGIASLAGVADATLIKLVRGRVVWVFLFGENTPAEGDLKVA